MKNNLTDCFKQIVSRTDISSVLFGNRTDSHLGWRVFQGERSKLTREIHQTAKPQIAKRSAEYIFNKIASGTVNFEELEPFLKKNPDRSKLIALIFCKAGGNPRLIKLRNKLEDLIHNYPLNPRYEAKRNVAIDERINLINLQRAVLLTDQQKIEEATEIICKQEPRFVSFLIGSIQNLMHHCSSNLARSQVNAQLALIKANGKPLELVEPASIPSKIFPHVVAATVIASKTPGYNLANDQLLGIGEELADILSCVLMAKALRTKILTPWKLRRFYWKNRELFKTKTREAYAELYKLAKKEVAGADLNKLSNIVPLLTSNKKLLKDLLAAFVLLQTTAMSRSSNLKVFNEKYYRKCAAEEFLEFKNEINRISDLKVEFEEPDLKNPQDIDKLAHYAYGIANYFLPDLSHTKALNYLVLKHLGRQEHRFTKKFIPYNRAKHQAKAWEKLLEAYCFKTMA